MNFAQIVSATFTATVNGADVNTAARAAFPVLVKGKTTIAALLVADRESQQSRRSLDAADQTIAAGLRLCLQEHGTDVTDAAAVRNALRVAVWADEGETMPESKPAEGTDERRTYQRISTRLSRLASDIVGKDRVVHQKAAVRVPKAVQSSIDALIAAHGAAIVREALKRAAAK